VYRVHQDECAPVAVEAIEAADRRCQREQILFRHLEDMFVRMILRLPRKRLASSIQFDVTAQDETDWAIVDEGGDPFCAG
jgi:hypothetical protein